MNFKEIFGIDPKAMEFRHAKNSLNLVKHS